MKLLAITIVLNLITTSWAIQLMQADILAFPRYKVLLTNDKISNSQNKDIELSSKTNTMILTSASGQPFSCSIPNVQVEKEKLEREKEERAKEETEQDIQNTIDRGLELLEPLGINCMRFYASADQYWVYEYCHNQHVRQFHVERSHDGKVEKEKETASFYLGMYPGASEPVEKSDIKALSSNTKPKKSTQKAPAFMRKAGDQRYLVQEWKNGSNCDLTDKPRTVEVQYHCDTQGQDGVTSFVEVSTCQYQMVISTPRLCEEMSLSHRYQAASHKIECRPIVSDKLIEQEEKKNQLLEQEQKPQEQTEPTQVQTKEQTEVVETKTDTQPTEELMEPGASTETPKDDKLLHMISDLTSQITQLRAQIDEMSSSKPKFEKAEYALFTIDENGKIIAGTDFEPFVQKTPKRPEEPKNKSKDQQKNNQAYQQNYVAPAAQ